MPSPPASPANAAPTPAEMFSRWRSETFAAELAGRERWAELLPGERAAALAEIVRAATNAPSEYERRWARGWLDAHRGSPLESRP